MDASHILRRFLTPPRIKTWEVSLLELQVADFFYCGGDGKDSNIVALRICGKEKKAWSAWVIAQSCSYHDFAIIKRHFYFSARWLFFFQIVFPLIVLVIPGEIPNEEDCLQLFHQHFDCHVRRFCGEEIWKRSLFGKKSWLRPLTRLPIDISCNHFNGFHATPPNHFCKRSFSLFVKDTN